MKIRIFTIVLFVICMPYWLYAGDQRYKNDAEFDAMVKTCSGNPIKLRRFYSDVQKAVRMNDKMKVLSYLHYPINIRNNCRNTRFTKAEEILPFYDRIFNKDVRDKISKAKLFDVWYRMGFTIGDGVIWFDQPYVEKDLNINDYQIYTVNSSDLSAHVNGSDEEEYLPVPKYIFGEWKVRQVRQARDGKSTAPPEYIKQLGKSVTITKNNVLVIDKTLEMGISNIEYDDAFIRYSLIVEGNDYEIAPYVVYDHQYWHKKLGNKDSDYKMLHWVTRELIFCSQGHQMAVFYIDKNKHLIFVKGEVLYEFVKK